MGWIEIDEITMVFRGLRCPQSLYGLEALVEEKTTRLRIGAVIAQLLDVSTDAHAEYEPTL